MSFSIDNLKYYDLKSRQWTLEQISESIKSLGNVARIVGRVADMDALNAIEEPKIGDIYFVGEEGSPEFEEYIRTELDVWEYIGVTTASIDGYVDTYDLYIGGSPEEPGEGTVEDPAEDTILYSIKNYVDSEINRLVSDSTNTHLVLSLEIDELRDSIDETTQSITALSEKVESLNQSMDSPFSDEDIDTMFEENTTEITNERNGVVGG